MADPGTVDPPLRPGSCREGLQHDGEDRHQVSTLTRSCLTQCITGMQDQCLVSLLSVGDHASFAEFSEEGNPRVQHGAQGVITWQLRGDAIVFTGMEANACLVSLVTVGDYTGFATSNKDLAVAW